MKADFIFITCQVHAEGAVKAEVARRWTDFRFAYSQPGFLTFKLTEGRRLPSDFDLDAVFARAWGISIGGVRGETRQELIEAVWKISRELVVQRCHVWEKDRAAPGDHGYEPGITTTAEEVHRAILASCPYRQSLAAGADELGRPARSGEVVLDCVLFSPGHWWAGYHRVGAGASRFPGGMMPLRLPPDAVSRAWLKMEEALQWSQLPIVAGARVAEIGSAPGGASQALLARGLHVTGIDPGEMAPSVVAHHNFTHIRQRSTQVQRRKFRKIRWLTADMNVAPNYTLDAVEAIVTHADVNIRGMLLTLKLPQWSLADRVPEYLERVRGWGYNVVRARQLTHNRREICVAALQKPFRRK